MKYRVAWKSTDNPEFKGYGPWSADKNLATGAAIEANQTKPNIEHWIEEYSGLGFELGKKL